MKNANGRQAVHAASPEVFQLLGILARVTRRIVDENKRSGKPRSTKQERKA